MRLAGPITQFWGIRTRDTRFRIARGWLSDLLRHADGLAPERRAGGLVSLAFVASMINDLPTLIAASDEALPLAREIGPSRVLGLALWSSGYAAMIAHPDDAVALLEESIAVAEQVGDVRTLAFATGHLCQAHLLWRGDIRRGLPLAERRLAEVEPTGERHAIGSARCYLGIAYAAVGRLADADRLLEAAAEGYQAIGNSYWYGFALSMLATNAYLRGDRDGVRLSFAERPLAITEGFEPSEFLTYGALALADVDGGRFEEAEHSIDEVERRGSIGAAAEMRGAMFNVGASMSAVRAYARLAAGDVASARSALTDVLASYQDVVGYGIAALFLGALVERAAGDPARAERYIDEALLKVHDGGSLVNGVSGLAILGVLRADVNADVEAVRLLAASAAAREHMGVTKPYPAVLDVDGEAAALRERLGDEAFDEAWTAGEVLSVEDALEYATRGRGPRQRPQAGWDALTPTELKVVALVAEGLSNPQIAERLFISKRTVSTHLSHVFSKVGVASRAELAAEATKRSV